MHISNKTNIKDYPYTDILVRMIKRILHNGVTWVDMSSPSSEDISKITEEFDLHPLVVSELLSQSLRPKIDIHKDYLYIILHFADDKEVDFVLGKDFLITTKYDDVEPISKLSHTLAKDTQMHGKDFNPGILFYYITKDLYEELSDELTRLRAHMKNIEELVYSGKERDMVLALAKSGRQILDLQQSLEPHKEVLVAIEHSSQKLYGEHFKRYADALLGNYHKIDQRIKRIFALHGELRATNDSLLSTKQNAIMQVLTIVAFVTLVPSLIASIFGMNARNMPFIGHQYDFWIIVVLMIIASLGTSLLFKYKRWM